MRKSSNKSLKFLLPIIIIIGIIPLIVYAKVMTYNTQGLSWYASDTTYLADIFTYYKSRFLLITALFMLIILLVKSLFDRSYLINKVYSPVYAYLLLILLSTIFSVSTYFSTSGYINHLESTYVLIAYMIVFLYTTSFLQNLNDFIMIVRVWVISIGLLFLIGLTQFLGFDIYRTSFGLSLIIPPSMQEQITGTTFTLWSDNLIYQSLYHYNYVSFYSAIAFPFFFALLIGTKVKRDRIIFGMASIILIFNLFGSQGRSGFIGVFIGGLIVAIFYGRTIITRKFVLIPIISSIILLGLVVTFTDSIIEKRILEAFTGLNERIDYPLNSILTNESELLIDHDELKLTINAIETNGHVNYNFKSMEGSAIEVDVNDNILTFMPSDDDLNNYSVISGQQMVYNDFDILQLTIDNTPWNFVYDKGTISYFNPYGISDQLVKVTTIGFDGTERWGSKRGYIWSRTLPMILDHPLLGTGPDTYAISFPQNDYVGKFNAYGNMKTIVDKPHNIYLNYASNTGIPSLIAILTILGIAFYQTFKTYFTKVQSDYRTYAIASIGAMSGYLSAGLFNDTSLQITPIFWVVVGINYAACKLDNQ